MKIVETTPYHRKKHQKRISFYPNGRILISYSLIEAIASDVVHGRTFDEWFVHFYTDEDKSRLGISVDKNKTNGVQLRFNLKKLDSGNVNISFRASSISTVEKLQKHFDWPLAPDKLHRIIYEYDYDRITLEDDQKTVIHLLK